MLAVQTIISLIQPPQQERAEEDRPDAVSHLLEAHELLGEHMTHVHPAMVPADSAVGADVAGLEVARILRRPERARIGPRRGPR